MRLTPSREIRYRGSVLPAQVGIWTRNRYDFKFWETPAQAGDTGPTLRKPELGSTFQARDVKRIMGKCPAG